jgi:hypothetical protein
MNADLFSLVALLAVGLFAGFVNTLAGGGSFLTVPAMMMLGLPVEISNATNRVAVFAQSSSAAIAFHREGKLASDSARDVVPPTVVGAVLGALLASYAPREILKPVLLATMVGMALLMVFRPTAIVPEGETPKRLRERPLSALALFATGVYGGFLQAGVGFVLLAVLGGTLRYDLVRANALKVVITLLYGLVAVIVFAARDQIAWVPGLVLAVAQSIGSVLGVRFAVRVPARVLRWVVLVAVLGACVGAAIRT